MRKWIYKLLYVFKCFYYNIGIGVRLGEEMKIKKLIEYDCFYKRMGKWILKNLLYAF